MKTLSAGGQLLVCIGILRCLILLSSCDMSFIQCEEFLQVVFSDSAFFSHVFSSPPNNQFPSLVVFSDIFSVMVACFFFELELMALLHGCAIPWIF